MSPGVKRQRAAMEDNRGIGNFSNGKDLLLLT